jgi:transposase
MIPASVRIFVCTRPHDMRCSYDTLALAAQKVLRQDPRSGALFVFTNKRHNRLKVLWWDQNGYCLLCKRLHQALFRMPVPSGSSDSSVLIDGLGLAELLHGVASARTSKAQNRS